jgi:AbrB family looped-hinge helix DNA binding protein
MPFGINNTMKSAVSIDKAGRLVLPQQVRRRFRLLAGDSLDLEIVADGIFLRTRSRQGDLVEENGLLVHEGEAVGDLAPLVERTRNERDADVLGLLR